MVSLSFIFPHPPEDKPYVSLPFPPDHSVLYGIAGGGGGEHKPIMHYCPENTPINYDSHTWYHRYCTNAGITPGRVENSVVC